MKRLVFACMFAASGAHAAFAADYRVPFVAPPLEAPPAAAPPLEKKDFDWGRCYAGLQAGMKIVDNQISFERTDFYVAEQIKTTSDTLPGPVAGGQIGCNHILSGGFLAGFEAEALWGPKKQIDCASQVDPVGRCVELRKRIEGFASVRLGYLVGASALCDCLNGLMLYGRVGVGYTETDAKVNVNTVAYRNVLGGQQDGADFYVPQYAQDYDLVGSRGMFGPLIGFGFERAFGDKWTARVDMSAMVTAPTGLNLSVRSAKLYGATENTRTPGAPLPPDSTGLVRNPKLGDILQAKMQEVETRLTFGLNRMF